MNWRLLFLRLYLPRQLKRRQLSELHERSGVAWGCVCPPDCGMAKAASYRQLLETFATFTREQARLAMASAASPEVFTERLRREAGEMGRNLRKRLRLRTQGEFRTAMRIVYRALDIDLRVSASGEVLVRRCFFSRFYSGAVCRFMSALDDGLVEGLSGGYRLSFTHRLTEGHPCCRATIERPAGTIERPAGRNARNAGLERGLSDEDSHCCGGGRRRRGRRQGVAGGVPGNHP